MIGLLLSGGMDSTSLAYWKRPEIGITVDYGQRPADAEIQASAAVCKTLGIRHEVVRADCSAFGSGDMAGSMPSDVAPVPEWWPFRNQLILTLAGMAAIKFGVTELMIGALATDGAHADGRPEFIDAISALMSAQEGGIRVTAPAITMTAVELVVTPASRPTCWAGRIPATSATSRADNAGDARSTTPHGRRSATTLFDEPCPRTPPLPWTPFKPKVLSRELLPVPRTAPSRDFQEVLEARRSTVAGPIGWDAIGELLWHSIGVKGYADTGRAGIRVEWRPYPASGGLHPISAVCISGVDDEAPRLYDPNDHAFEMLDTDAEAIAVANATDLDAVVGMTRGCTIRFIADAGKTGAAYENCESLLLRDAGCMLATISLCAEWLGLRACPLGFLGQTLVLPFGFPSPRFRAVGGILISSA